LSVAIDPRSRDSAAETPPEPVPGRAPVVSVIHPRPRPVVAERHWSALLGVSTALGTSPEPEVGVRAGVEFRSHQFSIALAAPADLPSSTQRIAGPFTSSLLVAELALCGRLVWTLDVCELAVGGVAFSTDSGPVARPFSQDGYAALGGRISADLASWDALALRLS